MTKRENSGHYFDGSKVGDLGQRNSSAVQYSSGPCQRKSQDGAAIRVGSSLRNMKLANIRAKSSTTRRGGGRPQQYMSATALSHMPPPKTNVQVLDDYYQRYDT